MKILCLLRSTMVDTKTKFVLLLRGKQNFGHLSYWTVIDGDLAGLNDIRYDLIGRDGDYEIINNEYVIGKRAYWTLGEECTHTELVKFYVKSLRKKYNT